MTGGKSTACRDTLGRVSAYLDGDLDKSECVLIEQHCRECADCARLVDGLRRTVGMCQDAAKAPLPKEVRDRARASVRHLLENPKRKVTPHR